MSHSDNREETERAIREARQFFAERRDQVEGTMATEINHQLIAALQAPLTREELERIFPKFSPSLITTILILEENIRKVITSVIDGTNDRFSYSNYLPPREAEELFEGIVSARSGIWYAVGVEEPVDGLMRSLGLPPEAKYDFWKASLDVMDDEQLAEYLEFVNKYEAEREKR